MSSKQEKNSGSPPLKKNLNRMFLEGNLSDITVKAFGRAWNLHRNILAGNSPYFMSLFAKGWKDSKEKVVELQIPDQRVTVDGLHVCFQSMYAFEVELTRANVVSMLAAASFLQLDDQIPNCYKFMVESLGMDTVVDCLRIVTTYGGGKALEKAAFERLENCLTLIKFQDEVSKISPELMTKIAASGNLFCAHEGSLLFVMVLWLYIKVRGLIFEESVPIQERMDTAFDYFKNLEGSTPFLSTDAGRPYVDAFRQIRVRDLLITRVFTVSSLEQLKILPHKWIEIASFENLKRIEKAVWKYHSISQNVNHFPPWIVSAWHESMQPNLDEFDPCYFHENCVRLGATYFNYQSFSNTIPNMLIELEIIAQKIGTKCIIKIKRSIGTLDPEPDTKKEILVRGRMVKMALDGKVLFTQSSSIEKTSLKVGEEFEVLKTEENLTDYLVSVSINYLF